MGEAANKAMPVGTWMVPVRVSGIGSISLSQDRKWHQLVEPNKHEKKSE